MLSQAIIDKMKQILLRPFYTEILNALNYKMEDFISKNKKMVLKNKSIQVIDYTEKILLKNIKIIKKICETIFDEKCTPELSDQILNSLKKNIDIDDVLNSDCLEIDLYTEYILENNLNNCDNFIEKSGHEILRTDNTSLLDVLIEYNLDVSKKSIVNNIYETLTKHSSDKKFIKNINTSIIKYYKSKMNINQIFIHPIKKCAMI